MMETYRQEEDDVDWPEIELFDLIEYEDNEQQRLAYYIGEGQFVLIQESIVTIQTDGYKPKDLKFPSTVTPAFFTARKVEDKIDVPTIIEWKKIATCKYKIKRDDVKWRNVENGIDDIKEHDVIEIAHSAGIRHFAICSGNGKAVDLNPEHSAYVIGKPPFSSFSRPSRLADVWGVESGEPPKNANGIIRERPILEVIKNHKFRIRSPQILVDIKRSNQKKIYYVEPLPTDQIRERIKKALDLGRTQYNICRKNCEHFIMWLKYDVIISYQTQRLKLVKTPQIIDNQSTSSSQSSFES